MRPGNRELGRGGCRTAIEPAWARIRSNGTFPTGEEDFPVGGVSWYEAAAYARFAKMQLPTSAHWSRAASRNQREVLWMYIESSNMNGAGVRRTGLGTMNVWGLYDVAGNVREWCANPIDSGRLTRGGTWEDSPFHIGHLIAKAAFDRSPGNGFRLARITDADSIVQRLSMPIVRNYAARLSNGRPCLGRDLRGRSAGCTITTRSRSRPGWRKKEKRRRSAGRRCRSRRRMRDRAWRRTSCSPGMSALRSSP